MQICHIFVALACFLCLFSRTSKSQNVVGTLMNGMQLHNWGYSSTADLPQCDYSMASANGSCSHNTNGMSKLYYRQIYMYINSSLSHMYQETVAAGSEADCVIRCANDTSCLAVSTFTNTTVICQYHNAIPTSDPTGGSLRPVYFFFCCGTTAYSCPAFGNNEGRAACSFVDFTLTTSHSRAGTEVSVVANSNIFSCSVQGITTASVTHSVFMSDGTCRHYSSASANAMVAANNALVQMRCCSTSSASSSSSSSSNSDATTTMSSSASLERRSVALSVVSVCLLFFGLRTLRLCN